MLLQVSNVVQTDYLSKISIAVEYAPKLAGAIIVYLIGSMIIGWIKQSCERNYFVHKI